jgi:ESS family glutamate:Na+ symporter
MNFPWSLFIDLGIVSAGLLLATFLRTKIRFFQTYLIPNALTAGFLLLPVYNYLMPVFGVTTDGLGSLVYHLLNLSFVAMTLRNSPSSGRKGDMRIFGTSVAILSQYAVQALIGLGATLLFIASMFPDLFPAFGLFLPLGYALGPGQAFAIGTGWESFGFAGAGSIGLTFAAVGYLWASFGGIFLINYGIKKKWMRREEIDAIDRKGLRTGIFPKGKKLEPGSYLTTETEAIDAMTYNAGVVLTTYLLSYFLLHGLTYLLSFLGKPGHDLAVNLWGIAFIFSALTALGVKLLLKAFKIQYTVDNGSLTRLAGLSVDIMVAGSIAAISLVVVGSYWFQILVICILGSIATIVMIPWMCSRLFTDHQFHRTLMIFGVSTGTLPTGLALLRVIDPDFETPVASDYMYSSGLTFVLAIPFILVINGPANSYVSGNPLPFWTTMIVAFGYLVFTTVAFVMISKRRAYRDISRIWFRAEGGHERGSRKAG